MEFIPVNSPKFYGDELRIVTEAIQSGWISSESPYVSEFETLVANISNRKYGIAVSNGTAALEIAIRSLGISEGDEVILPSFTIISCAQAITKVGAIPVLVDSDIHTWNMDTNLIEQAITSRTKAIMMVHIYGLPVNVSEILRIAEKYNLRVIEDAAESIGLKVNGLPCGSFGDVSTMSFYANKHITTGEGGMLLTNRSDVYEKSKYLRNLCFDENRRFKHEEIGWNYRISGIQAAFGIGQAMNLDLTIKRKQEIGALYQRLLADESRILKPLEFANEANNVYWVFAIVVDPKFGLKAEEIATSLHKKGIGTRPFFYPLHEQPVLRNMGLFENASFPISELLATYGLYLPSGTNTSDADIKYSAEKLIEVLNEYDL